MLLESGAGMTPSGLKRELSSPREDATDASNRESSSGAGSPVGRCGLWRLAYGSIETRRRRRRSAGDRPWQQRKRQNGAGTQSADAGGEGRTPECGQRLDSGRRGTGFKSLDFGRPRTGTFESTRLFRHSRERFVNADSSGPQSRFMAERTLSRSSWVLRDGKTALMLASQHGHRDVVKALIKAGANVHASSGGEIVTGSGLSYEEYHAYTAAPRRRKASDSAPEPEYRPGNDRRPDDPGRSYYPVDYTYPKRPYWSPGARLLWTSPPKRGIRTSSISSWKPAR